MGKKVILVTGANKGIGLAIVETLLQQLPEAVVLLGSRDAGRGWSAFYIYLPLYPKIPSLSHNALSSWFQAEVRPLWME